MPTHNAMKRTLTVSTCTIFSPANNTKFFLKKSQKNKLEQATPVLGSTYSVCATKVACYIRLHVAVLTQLNFQRINFDLKLTCKIALVNDLPSYRVLKKNDAKKKL